MIFCRACGKQHHETATSCPHCGAIQLGAVATPTSQGTNALWLAVTSLFLGLFCLICLLDDSKWDRDQVIGLLFTVAASSVLGAISISQKRSGKRMAIAGIALSMLSLLMFLGTH
ncbi:MAG: zinc ribbon domain-containing protein [Ideonella sp.]|nr:zinc ribbon domain-containing protein [Ideonella sp.]